MKAYAHVNDKIHIFYIFYSLIQVFWGVFFQLMLRLTMNTVYKKRKENFLDRIQHGTSVFFIEFRFFFCGKN